MEEFQQNTPNPTNDHTVKSAASFAAAQLTIFYLFWIMFLGEVIRWNLPDGSTVKPIRDDFLIPFANIFVVDHHWVGKIITGAILLLITYVIAKQIKCYKNMSEEKMIKNGYALVVAFWVYAVLTFIYFIGHMNHFWFF